MKSIMIVGPTGVGKTDIAESVARSINGQIINMDMGQLYSDLSIGTAKPKAHEAIQTHLFSVIDEPIDYDVVRYRKAAQSVYTQVAHAGHTPLFVGGSLFYAQALLFALPEIEKRTVAQKNNAYTWERVYEIDPLRAVSIHKNDQYRIIRAIEIWERTGIRPSQMRFMPNAIMQECMVLWLYREKNELHALIEQRVEQMIGQGWMDEVRALGAEWRIFLKRKKLCGYDVLVEALAQGRMELLPEEKEAIKKVTKAYAKRQSVFWQKLKQMITHSFSHEIIECNLTTMTAAEVVARVKEWRNMNDTQ